MKIAKNICSLPIIIQYIAEKCKSFFEKIRRLQRNRRFADYLYAKYTIYCNILHIGFF